MRTYYPSYRLSDKHNTHFERLADLLVEKGWPADAYLITLFGPGKPPFPNMLYGKWAQNTYLANKKTNQIDNIKLVFSLECSNLISSLRDNDTVLEAITDSTEDFSPLLIYCAAMKFNEPKLAQKFKDIALLTCKLNKAYTEVYSALYPDLKLEVASVSNSS